MANQPEGALHHVTMFGVIGGSTAASSQFQIVYTYMTLILHSKNDRIRPHPKIHILIINSICITFLYTLIASLLT